MNITNTDMDKLAKLARLKLSGDERDKLRGDLTKILDYVEQLNEVDVEGIEPMVSVLDGAKTVFRKDDIKPSLSQEEALQNAPDKNSDYFKVPKVL